MSALSIQVPFPVFQDRDGQPLDNGYVWIGVANLQPQTNPVIAYFDEALTIIAAQPLRTINGFISNSGTPAQVYVDAVNFSILVQDSKGTMIYNFPDGTGISPNASGIIYDPAGTGAVATTVQAKLRESVSVKDFGATGDGVIDDTAAIQAAITSATSAGAELVFPAGTYRHTTALTFTCNVQGHGMPRIKSVGDIKSVIVTNFYGYFKGIKIEPDGTGTTSNDGLTIAGGARTLFENVLVLSCGNDGIVFDSTTFSNNIASLNNVQSRLNGRDGIRFELGADNNACLLTNVDVSSNTGNGLTMTGICAGTVFNNVAAQNNTGYGIAYLGANARNNIGTAYVETNTAGDVYFDASAHSNMIWLSNDGSSRVDSNGTNIIISAGSGSTSVYNFNQVDFTTFRINNTVNSGQLEASHTGTRAFAFTALGSTSAFTTTFAKGAASAHGLIVEGNLVSTTAVYPSNPTSNSYISSGAGSPEGAVTAIRGSLFMRNDGGAGTSLYVKESGTGNTGWAAK